MPDQFTEMNDWTSDQVAAFKDGLLAIDATPIAASPTGHPPVSSAGATLVAEGDSWFDYLPGTDLIDCLRQIHGHRIENFAKAGDTLENMIYGTGIDRDFTRTSPQIDRVLRRLGELKPPVFLFSGGGNDVAGEEFDGYLSHASSGLTPLRADYATDLIGVVFRTYFEDLIARVQAVSPGTHIVTHGYGHTVPTGDGVSFWFFDFAGPWLRPALAMKGIFDPVEQRNIVFELIDLYNDMLSSLATVNPTFHHVDLRPIIDPDSDWSNELHLKNAAYARAAGAIDAAIQPLL